MSMTSLAFQIVAAVVAALMKMAMIVTAEAKINVVVAMPTANLKE